MPENPRVMLALAALAGLLTAILVAAVRVAYLAIPSGRLCPECGGGTSAVEMTAVGRLVAAWLQRRWCSRCGWEGLGRRGPDVAAHEAPVDHDSGFRWQRPDGHSVPIFWWASGEETFGPPDHPLRRPADDLPPSEIDAPDHPSGFRFADEEDARGPVFEWNDDGGRTEEQPRPPRRTFHWKPPER